VLFVQGKGVWDACLGLVCRRRKWLLLHLFNNNTLSRSRFKVSVQYKKHYSLLKRKKIDHPCPLFHPSIHPSIHLKRFFDFINPDYSKYGWYELCCHNRYLTQPASQLLMYLFIYLLTHSLCSKELKPAKILLSSTVIRKPPGLLIKTLLSTVDMLVVLLILQYLL